jgi:hypothetical protein
MLQNSLGKANPGALDGNLTKEELKGHQGRQTKGIINFYDGRLRSTRDGQVDRARVEQTHEVRIVGSGRVWVDAPVSLGVGLPSVPIKKRLQLAA